MLKYINAFQSINTRKTLLDGKRWVYELSEMRATQ
jgi:hypothetical protein